MKSMLLALLLTMSSTQIWAQSKGISLLDTLFTFVKREDGARFKNVKELDSFLMRELKKNPEAFGLKPSKVPIGNSIADIKNERVLIELLTEGPRLLKISSKVNIAQKTFAANYMIKTSNLDYLNLTQNEQTGLGRQVSLAIKKLRLETSNEIGTKIFLNAKALAKMSKGNEAQLILSRQIINQAVLLSESTKIGVLGDLSRIIKDEKLGLEFFADLMFKLNDMAGSRVLRKRCLIQLAIYQIAGEELKKSDEEVEEYIIKLEDIGFFGKGISNLSECR